MSNSDNSTKASLGCGSLILIAIIVLIFGNRGDDQQHERLLNETRSDIEKLRLDVAAQSAALSRIEQALEKLAPPPPVEAE